MIDVNVDAVVRECFRIGILGLASMLAVACGLEARACALGEIRVERSALRATLRDTGVVTAGVMLVLLALTGGRIEDGLVKLAAMSTGSFFGVYLILQVMEPPTWRVVGVQERHFRKALGAACDRLGVSTTQRQDGIELDSSVLITVESKPIMNTHVVELVWQSASTERRYAELAGAIERELEGLRVPCSWVWVVAQSGAALFVAAMGFAAVWVLK